MFQSQESKDLFVYISWKTRGGKPLLADDQVRQAAYLAIKRRTRIQLCRTLAISGTCTQVNVVFQFPASLPVAQIAATAMQAAGESVAQLSEALYSRRLDVLLLWEKEVTTCTLSQCEAAEAQTYLCTQAACRENAPTILSTTLV